MARTPRAARIALLIALSVPGAVALWAAMDAWGGAGARTNYTDVWRTPAGHERGGYISEPEFARRALNRGPDAPPRATPSPDGSLPAIVLIHGARGLDRDTIFVADVLASDGFVVLAPDLYRGRRAVSRPGAWLLRVSRPSRAVAADFDLAREILAASPAVDGERIVVVDTSGGVVGARAVPPDDDVPRPVGIDPSSAPELWVRRLRELDP